MSAKSAKPALPALTWEALQTHLMDATDADAVLALLRAECKGPRRHAFMNRLFGRYVVLRTEHDRKRMYAKEWPK